MNVSPRQTSAAPSSAPTKTEKIETETDMTTAATMDGERAERRPMTGAEMLRDGRWIALLRSALSGTRLLDRVVRSLSRRVVDLVPCQAIFISSLLLKPMQALMLVGIRSAGAGGGGPGH